MSTEKQRRDLSTFRSRLLLAAVGFDSTDEHRRDVLDALTSTTGLPLERLGFNVVRSTADLAPGLGQALFRGLDVLVVVCPDVLQGRVLDELGRLHTADKTTVVLVLCGEETSFEVLGPPSNLKTQLRAAVGPLELEDLPCPVESVHSWSRWKYDTWNDALVEYCLRAVQEDDVPVERLAATPEELTIVVGADPAQATSVTGAFVRACVQQLPRGKSFCGFCQEYDWMPESCDVPPFFGMLWLTCLVAYGYPTAEEGFFKRFWEVIGNKDHARCMPDLWRATRSWTLARRRTDPSWRELVLPPDDDYLTTIGHSHFLAFPHKQDRRKLAFALIEAKLVGFEPPITPVVSLLESEGNSFSSYFQGDLTRFVERYVTGDQDPRTSAFWRAVRQEALQPSVLRSAGRIHRRMTSLLGVFDEEGFLPLLGCRPTWSPSPGLRILPLDSSIGGFTHFASLEEAGVEGLLPVLFDSMAFLGPGPRALMSQGVLIFQEDQPGEYFLVSGHDVAGADVALVREDLIDPFVAVFGGVSEPSRVKGWSEVTRCQVRPLDHLPETLVGVVQLLRTMNPPTLRFVGGIQVPGGYLGFEGLLPRVRASDARMVRATRDGASLACSQSAELEWELPSRIAAAPLPADVLLEGEWCSQAGARVSGRLLRLKPATVVDDFKPLAGGHYFVESCCPGQQEVAAGESIPLFISTRTNSATYDLLDCDPSARFLGPGLGEMSLRWFPGSDWLAVGPKNAPELLVFVGDPMCPQVVAPRRSPDGGDRRHWRKAFAKARRVVVRTEDGEYLPIDCFPHLKAMKERYSRHDPPRSATHTTQLNTLSPGSPGRCATSPQTERLADALAALSARRGGLRYGTVQMLLRELVGLDDPLLHHELVRAWAESGLVDIVRHQSFGSTRVIARRPRFVAVRRGPEVEASLLGLVTSTRRAQVERAASAAGLALQSVKAGCPWQPSILRVRASWDEVQNVSLTAEIEAPEWLLWGVDGSLHETLRVDLGFQGLRSDPPPQGYTASRTWDWDRRIFVRGVEAVSRVRVEQRVHPQTCSIYVVLVEDRVVAWTYIRNWALLCAFEAAELAPFEIARNGWVTTRGRSPVHLPLPIGRVCAVVGEGLPGPLLVPHSTSVGGYCYPFGKRVTDLVSLALPAAWAKMEGN